MFRIEPIYSGEVQSLAINGESRRIVRFTPENGPVGDDHGGCVRSLSGHDGNFRQITGLSKGRKVADWRQWTALSAEELSEIQKNLGVSVPVGCFLENLIISGIPNFSKLPGMSLLLFPPDQSGGRAAFSVTGENTPCGKIAVRLAEHYNDTNLAPKVKPAATDLRGLMGRVESAGNVCVGDRVDLFAAGTWHN